VIHSFIAYKIVIFAGKPIPINSTVDILYPTVSMFGKLSFEANFGDDLSKPFKYDINKFPWMGVHVKITYELYALIRESNSFFFYFFLFCTLQFYHFL
jgi:hypothetical protein